MHSGSLALRSYPDAATRCLSRTDAPGGNPRNESAVDVDRHKFALMQSLCSPPDVEFVARPRGARRLGRRSMLHGVLPNARHAAREMPPGTPSRAERTTPSRGDPAAFEAHAAGARSPRMADVVVRFPNASFLREWDARGYDRVAETMSAWSRAAGAGRALLLERAGITPGQRVLDLCSGPGWLAIEAARAVAPDGHGVAKLERENGFEPTTLCLGSRGSTARVAPPPNDLMLNFFNTLRLAIGGQTLAFAAAQSESCPSTEKERDGAAWPRSTTSSPPT